MKELIFLLVTFFAFKTTKETLIKSEYKFPNAQAVTNYILLPLTEGDIYLFSNVHEAILWNNNGVFRVREFSKNNILAKPCTQKIIVKERNVAGISCFLYHGKLFLLGEIDLTTGLLIGAYEGTGIPTIYENDYQMGIDYFPNGNYIITYTSSNKLDAVFIEYDISTQKFLQPRIFMYFLGTTPIDFSFRCSFIWNYEVFFCLTVVNRDENGAFYFLLNKNYQTLISTTYIGEVGNIVSSWIYQTNDKEGAVFGFSQRDQSELYIGDLSLKYDNGGTIVLDLNILNTMQFFSYSNDVATFMSNDIFAFTLWQESPREFLSVSYYSRKLKSIIYHYQSFESTELVGNVSFLAEKNFLFFLSYNQGRYRMFYLTTFKCRSATIYLYDENEHSLDFNLLYDNTQQNLRDESGYQIKITFLKLPNPDELTIFGEDANGEVKEIELISTSSSVNVYKSISYKALSMAQNVIPFYVAKINVGIGIPSDDVCELNFEPKCFSSCIECEEKGNEVEHKCTRCHSDYHFLENSSNCYKDIPEYHFLDSDGVIKECYQSCKTCHKKGDFLENNCDTCRFSYVKETVYTTKANPGNCVKICNTKYSFWFINDTVVGKEYFQCTNKTKACPNDFPFLNPSNSECTKKIESSSLMEVERTRDNLKETILDFSSLLFENHECVDKISNEEFIIEFQELYEGVNTKGPDSQLKEDEAKNNKVTNFTQCEIILRNYYSISENDPIRLILFHSFNTSTKNEVNLEFYFLDSSGKQLSYSLCNKAELKVNVTGSDKFSLRQRKILNEGVSLFNHKDKFYHDYCQPHTADGKDTTIEIRRNYFLLNNTLCGPNCSLVSYYKKTDVLRCLCKITENSFYHHQYKYDLDFDYITPSALKLFKCFRLFSEKKLYLSLFFFFSLFLFLAQILMLVLMAYKFSAPIDRKNTVGSPIGNEDNRGIESINSKIHDSSTSELVSRRVTRPRLLKIKKRPSAKKEHDISVILSLDQIDFSLNTEKNQITVYQNFLKFYEIFLKKNPVYNTFFMSLKLMSKSIFIKVLKISYFIFCISCRIGISALVFNDQYIARNFLSTSEYWNIKDEANKVILTILFVQVIDYSFKILVYFIIQPGFKTEAKTIKKQKKILTLIYSSLVFIFQFFIFSFSQFFAYVYPNSLYRVLFCSSIAIIIHILIFPLICAGFIFVLQILFFKSRKMCINYLLEFFYLM